MKYFFAPVILLLLCSCGQKDDNHPLFHKASRELHSGNAKDAEVLFVKYLKINPDSIAAHRDLATIYNDHLNSPDKAIYHYRKFLELASPGNNDYEAVQAWITSSEQKYFKQLQERFGETHDVSSIVPSKTDEKLAEKDQLIERYREHLRIYIKKNQQLTDYLNKLKSESQLEPVSASAENATAEIPPPARQISPSDYIVQKRREAAFNIPVTETKTENKPEPNIYTVERGDTLIGISRRFYGNGGHYRLIMEANSTILNSPADLKIGQRLTIPQKPDQITGG
jgi:LysM repeat protein